MNTEFEYFILALEAVCVLRGKQKITWNELLEISKTAKEAYEDEQKKIQWDIDHADEIKFYNS